MGLQVLVPVLTILAALLLGALAPHDYVYFEILRWTVAMTAGGLTWAFAIRKNWVAALLAAIPVVLFNPITPILLSRGTWREIDASTGIICLFGAIGVLPKVEASIEDASPRSATDYNPTILHIYIFVAVLALVFQQPTICTPYDLLFWTIFVPLLIPNGFGVWLGPCIGEGAS